MGDVGGGVLTNFLNETHAQGKVTGDLRGAVSVAVLGVNGNVYHISKQLVTGTGDTVVFSNTDLTTYSTAVPGLVAVQEAIKVTGGTGPFDSATAPCRFWRDQRRPVTLLYEGTVCFPTVKEP